MEGLHLERFGRARTIAVRTLIPAGLFVSVSMLVFLAGCDDEEVLPEVQITSLAFHHEGTIPSRHTCKGEGFSVPLSIGEGPEGTMEFAVTMVEELTSGEDEAVTASPHWVVWGVDADSRHLGEGMPAEHEPKAGLFQGLNYKENHGYAPPCPDDGVEGRYVFRVYALDEAVSLGEEAGIGALEAAMEGRIIGKGELIGYYEKP